MGGYQETEPPSSTRRAVSLVTGQGNESGPLQLRLEARPEYAHLLRERLRMWLGQAGANDREMFEVLLATTEAFTNAVQHPQEPTSHLVEITGSITDHTVSVSIRDYGTWNGEPTRKEWGGRGMDLIEHLMDGVRVQRLLDGTTVTLRRRLAMH
jgi:anti-sigma regulatory factor (Ser/Thr protein kinase)